MRRYVFATILLLAFVGPVLAATTPEQRVALVIGNSAYDTSPLKNPANDARLIAETRARKWHSRSVIELT